MKISVPKVTMKWKTAPLKKWLLIVPDPITVILLSVITLCLYHCQGGLLHYRTSTLLSPNNYQNRASPQNLTNYRAWRKRENQNHHWGETVLIKMHPPPACSIYIYIYIYMHMYVYICIHTHVPLSVAIWKYTWNICTFCFLKTKGVYISICFSNCNVFENREYIYLCQPVERVCLLALRL